MLFGYVTRVYPIDTALPLFPGDVFDRLDHQVNQNANRLKDRLQRNHELPSP